MTYAELPERAWFILPRDPNEGLLFKCSSRSAMDRKYRMLRVSPDEEVILAVRPENRGDNRG